MRAPRPWTASLQRPAAKILVAGGLTLAGWLLGAALSGSTASAAGGPVCPEAPAISTVDHAAKPFSHARHRKSHHETGGPTCAAPKIDSAEPPPADETQQQADETPAAAETTKDSSPAEEPATTKTASEDSSPTEEPATTKATSEDSAAPKATSSDGNLLGGLVGSALHAVGGVAETTKDSSATEAPAKLASTDGDLLGSLLGSVIHVVGGTLYTVTGTVGAVTDTLSHTVLAPLTQPPADNPDAPVLLPLDDLLGPVLGGSSNSGGVTVTVPGVTTTGTQATVAETVPAAVPEAAATPQQTTRFAVAHLVVRQPQQLPVVQDQPRDSGTHARNGGSGGDSTPGLPGGGTTAPSAPAPTAAPGHDGPGGARHTFAVHTDDVTTTQLKLIGTSRDHEVDGAGREAALPTTSPD